MELSGKFSVNNDKIICLYCDKSFLNNVDQENHVERDHKTILIKGKGSRRKSERITKNLSLENSSFPGCFYCNNRKNLKTDDLDSLFHHLLSAHNDIYFGCKYCKIRIQDRVSLIQHKKICKIGGKLSQTGDKNVTEKRISKKKSLFKEDSDSKCDSLSETEDTSSTAGGSCYSSKILPANAIHHTKSDRNKLRNLSKSAKSSDNFKKHKVSSGSSTTSCSTTSSRNSEEYTIPLTRQKFKEPVLSRLGIAQNRASSNKKSQKTSKTAISSLESKNVILTSPTKVQRTKSSKLVNVASANVSDASESALKNEIVNAEFDKDFYKNISHNVRLNLNSFIDGKSDSLLNTQHVFEKITEQFASQNESGEIDDQPSCGKEIHEATNFELPIPFPALLTVEQYGFRDTPPNKIKRKITKNSWKWKWDPIKKYKYVNEGGKIVKKIKQVTAGLKDLSQLDMWTQLSMRLRHEKLDSNTERPTVDQNVCTRMIEIQKSEQLNNIMDQRLMPEINIEQLEQTIIKPEPVDMDEIFGNVKSEVPDNESMLADHDSLNMLSLMKLAPSKPTDTILSGEWARPRCYICIDCGQKFDLMTNLNEHKNSEHPYVVSAHYEIVGRENLQHKLYENLFLPKKAIHENDLARNLSLTNEVKSHETPEASNSSDTSSKFFENQKEKECTKCLKMIKYSNDIDIYRHILDCIEDRVWLQAKRRSKYRKSRRRTRKVVRKPRSSLDQKKNTSSPSPKETIEGDNTIITPPISNPPAPQNLFTKQHAKNNKTETLINENLGSNAKCNESMNIKNFFRVSKTTPALPQKVVVQMLEMPSNNNRTNSLRSSLRSSVKKSSNYDQNAKTSAIKHENISDINLNMQAKDEICEKDKSESAIDSIQKKEEIGTIQNEMKETQPHQLPNIEFSPSCSVLVPVKPLTIVTPEKSNDSLQLSSPIIPFLISPTSSSVPKKKKKLNDCIALLTCKLQEKLGVNFFENVSNDLMTTEKPQSSDTKQEEKLEISEPVNFPATCSSPKMFEEPIQQEVIDLSLKKNDLPKIELKENEKVETDQTFQYDNEIRKISSPVTNDVIENYTSTVEIKEEEEEIIVAQAEIISLETKIEIISEEVNCNTPEKITASEKFDSESFKISIDKDRIPNLDKILEQYQIITVNNIKISESERRAFEEQKNRIMQILGKVNRQLPVRQSSMRAAKKKIVVNKTIANKTSKKAIRDKIERKNEAEENNEKKQDIVEKKIEEVIKTTNRIRCRRLSVVVDPIVNLSAYQNKNRKIRLTNNSQQNGFYDLLTASQELFTDKKVQKEEAIAELISSSLKTTDESKNDPNIFDKDKQSTLQPANQNIKSKASKRTLSRRRFLSVESSKTENPQTEVDVDKQIPKSTEILNQLDQEPTVEIEKMVSVAPIKKLRGKKQNVENMVPSIDEKQEETALDVSPAKLDEKLLNDDIVVKPLQGSKRVIKEVKRKQRKFDSMKVAKFSQPNPCSKPDMSEENATLLKSQDEQNLDASFSSDASNENDIPLAKLIQTSQDHGKEQEPMTIENPAAVLKANRFTSRKRNERITKQSISVFEEVSDACISAECEIIEETIALIQSKDNEIVEVIAEKSLIDEKPIEIEKFDDVHNSDNESLEPKEPEKLEEDLKDVFTMNEDSLFNDEMDNENENNEKLNDIVNDIINSSELQNDSDTEKSDTNQSLDAHQFNKTEQNCQICNKIFRNEKALEKHLKTNTHLLKEKRKDKEIAKLKLLDGIKPTEMRSSSPAFDEMKIFRTKGALKTFDVPPSLSTSEEKSEKIQLLTKILDEPKLEFPSLNQDKDIEDVKHFDNIKTESKIFNDRDKIFDSLFANIQPSNEPKSIYTPKPNYPITTPQDSEIETSSTSWDLKRDSDIEWEGEVVDNINFEHAIKEQYPKKIPVKINKSKETAVSIPTKSLIMGKIFKKHRDREKQTTPQADAPNNKPGIKNSLDEIFDHLKNSAEIDDKVLTCPSPKTLLKSAGGTFSTHSSNSNDMLETASHSNNNNIYASKVSVVGKEIKAAACKADKKIKTVSVSESLPPDLLTDGEDGIGKRKSRRRCAIKAKTFAETWSSDEYEELHDTADIISIINEIEKRESVKKKKALKLEDIKKFDEILENDKSTKPEVTKISSVVNKPTDIKTNIEKCERKKSVQVQSVFDNKKRKASINDGHKSDDETILINKELPEKTGSSIKKRRMSCFVPSATSFNISQKVKEIKEIVTSKPKPVKAPSMPRMESEPAKDMDVFEFKLKPTTIKKAESEKSLKLSKKFLMMNNNITNSAARKKTQKHRKRPRNKIKNIAYDSDSDFELNLTKKARSVAFSDTFSEDEEESTPKPSSKSQITESSAHCSVINEMTMTKESKLLPNDLKEVIQPITSHKAAIPEDISDASSFNPCNRTKRHSSEKLYYWSSSTSDSDDEQEQGDTADGDKEDSMMPQQPEQLHGWIVGDSHKKLVTLLAHAKIKNKIN